ncbi:MotA/TolQ/ExbB proton channel family protein [Brevundimonas sp.]|uniref:MotA/TolQ/ExbB proton channel family protein n=1 Tax=Brevundimonas sp. TaxID=1871086 RepID=UPI0028A04B90|nr:MotA/TolQ/ExbB proton channel family protein [Brevundimonas sp.]
MSRALPLSLLLLVGMANPALAMPRLGFTTLVMLSHPLLKLLMLVVVIATIAAMVICVLKLRSGSKLVGGSAFVKALRLGGPLLGLLGASYAAMNIFIGLSSFSGPVNPAIYMPAVAEAFAVLIVGLISGVVAVIADWAIESRIDREVLRIQ